jgi:hypothetical protein
MAAAGFDHDVAIPSGVEARPKSDVKRDLQRQGSWRMFGQPTVDYDRDP